MAFLREFMGAVSFGVGLLPFARPYQWSLNRLFAGADRARVFDCGVFDGRAEEAEALLYEAPAEELGSLCEALRIDPLVGGLPCMCRGSLAVELWRGDELLTTLAVHHHKSIRVTGAWALHGVLRDGEGLARWLAERGRGEVLAAIECERERENLRSEDEKRHYREAPAPLRDVSGFSPSVESLVPRYADRLSLSQDLLRWYGSSRRPWSDGHLQGERNLHQALRGLGGSVLVEAVASGEADAGVLRGAARYWSAVSEGEQLELPDSCWELLQSDAVNAAELERCVARVARRRRRREPGARCQLGEGSALAEGVFRDLQWSEHGLYALLGSAIVHLPDGEIVFDSGCAEASFSCNLGLNVAVPSRSQVLSRWGRLKFPRPIAEGQFRPRMVRSSSFVLWTCGESQICDRERVLVHSPTPLLCACLAKEWIYWSNADGVFRQGYFDKDGSAERVLPHPALAMWGQGKAAYLACADGSVWLDDVRVGQTRFRPLAMVGDEDGVYVLTLQAEGRWALEHPVDGVLVGDLRAGAFPSLALSFECVYATVGEAVWGFERVP